MIKKVTKKSRLGPDVGLARQNLNGGSTRARFGYNKGFVLGAVRATLGLGCLNVDAKISTASPSIISYAAEQGADCGM
ncbi:hypothetical protein [Pedobacter sp. N23S346]|uniref:hypothetical protein n=1 Tax=Pedobacter sp. N23S346 TaxID=3402750 RepID=UPI003AC26EE0